MLLGLPCCSEIYLARTAFRIPPVSYEKRLLAARTGHIALVLRSNCGVAISSRRLCCCPGTIRPTTSSGGSGRDTRLTGVIPIVQNMLSAGLQEFVANCYKLGPKLKKFSFCDEGCGHIQTLKIYVDRYNIWCAKLRTFSEQKSSPSNGQQQLTDLRKWY